MSRNGSGTYTLPAGNPVVTGTTIASNWANTTMNDIASALTGSVAADGQTTMTGPLKMGSNRITGLAAGIAAGNAVEFDQFKTPIFTGIVTAQTDIRCTGTGQITLPVGTTAQRSTAPEEGMVRFNVTLGEFEGAKDYAGATISSITYVTTTATMTTASNHGLITGDYITVSGATPSEYNGQFQITVTGNTTLEYTMVSAPASNATVVGTYFATLWGTIGGGATGGGGDQVFVENGVTVTTNYTLTTNKNAMSVGPITVDSGVEVTIPAGQRWVVL
mgnify:CR=1 FL=1